MAEPPRYIFGFTSDADFQRVRHFLRERGLPVQEDSVCLYQCLVLTNDHHQQLLWEFCRAAGVSYVLWVFLNETHRIMHLYHFVLRRSHAKILIDFFYDQRDQIKLYEYDNGYLFAFKGYPLWTLGYLRLEEEEIFYQKFE